MSQSRAFPRRMVSLLLPVAVLASGMGRAVAVVGGPSITLDPDHGPPTSRTVVTGEGFGASEVVVVTFDTKPVGSTTTDPSGSFSTTVRVPKSATPGDHPITATGQTSGRVGLGGLLGADQLVQVPLRPCSERPKTFERAASDAKPGLL